VLCLEIEPGRRRDPRILAEVLARCARHLQIGSIETALFRRRAFPVDRRHNAKIDRSALAVWAERKLR
jgi:hypothetical protein